MILKGIHLGSFWSTFKVWYCMECHQTFMKPSHALKEVSDPICCPWCLEKL